MKTAILVKQVPDHEAIVQVEGGGGLKIEDRYVCSFFDEIAIEAAIGLKKENPDLELKAFSAGGKRAVEALRRAMAMGVDMVEQVGDEGLEGADSQVVATVLAAALRRFEPDLILCGKQAGDDDMGAIGPMISAMMELPVINAAVKLELDPASGRARAVRTMDGEVVSLESGLPLLVTAEKGLAEPHVPVVMRVMKAMRAKVPAVSMSDLGVADVAARTRRVGYQSPPGRPQVKMVESVDELARLLQQRGVLS